jgi:DHA1 family inner membrane transport protein
MSRKSIDPSDATSASVRPRIVLALLTLCVFSVGTAEWVMIGLVPELATDLQRSLSAVGGLISWYALVVTVAGPVITVLMLRMNPRDALLALLSAFVAGNVCAAVAHGLPMLLAARMFTALTHSTSFAVAVTIAISVTPLKHRGRAIAMVSAGWNLATVFGAPLGTWLGQHFGWRTTFWCIAMVAGLVVIAVTVMTRHATSTAPSDPRTEIRALANRRVGGVLVTAIVAQAGLFVVYTYVSPILSDVSGFGATAVAALLAGFGVGGLAGNLIGGRLAARHPWRWLCLLLTAMGLTLAAFSLAGANQWAAAATVLVMGAISGAVIPLIQERAIDAATSAPTLITAVAASAINLGIAGGAAIGGQALTAGVALSGLGWLGAGGTVVAVLTAALTARHRRRIDSVSTRELSLNGVTH